MHVSLKLHRLHTVTRIAQQTRPWWIILGLALGLHIASHRVRADHPAAPGIDQTARAATCRISTGCSGVCVHPLGLVLTARHCGLDERVQIAWPDGSQAAGLLAYVCPEGEGPLVYLTEPTPAPWPAVSVAEHKPEPGEDVFSWGYPQQPDGSRPLLRGAGVALGGSTGQLLIDGRPSGAPFPQNTTTIQARPGWSGGPLFNAAGEVIGLCSNGGSHRTSFISWQAIHTAVRTATLQAAGGSKPVLYVFTQDRCVPCRRFEQDHASGRLRETLARVTLRVIRWQDGTWVDETGQTAAAALAFRRQFGHDIQETPTFWIEGTRYLRTGYDNPTFLEWLGRLLLLPVRIIAGGPNPPPASEPIPPSAAVDDHPVSSETPPANNPDAPADSATSDQAADEDSPFEQTDTSPPDIDWSDITLVYLSRTGTTGTGLARAATRRMIERADSLGLLQRTIADITGGTARLETVFEVTQPERFEAVLTAARIDVTHRAIIVLVRRQELGLDRGVIASRIENEVLARLPAGTTAQRFPVMFIAERQHPEDYHAVTDALETSSQPGTGSAPADDSPAGSEPWWWGLIAMPAAWLRRRLLTGFSHTGTAP